MLLYPEVQAKAQAEIDSVIGHDRLPTQSVTPIRGRSPPRTRQMESGRPTRQISRDSSASATVFRVCHARDDVYEGYHIHKGDPAPCY